MWNGQHKIFILLVLAVSALLFIEPALANRLENIGGGISGSSYRKITWLKDAGFWAGGVMALCGVLALLTRKSSNAQMLNFTMAKESAIIFFVLSAIFFAIGIFA